MALNMKKISRYKFIPDTNIRLNQTNEISKVWPMSGCKINNNKTGKTTNVLKKNLKYLLEKNLEPITKDRNTIKKGFKNSIGWNLGKKEKSNHLLDPFTSTPKKGTNSNDIKKIINSNVANL